MDTTSRGKQILHADHFLGDCSGTVPVILHRAAGETLCDVGCGTGELLRAATRMGFRATGVDADPRMVDAAGLGTPSGVEVHRAALPDISGLGTFQTVIANFVLDEVEQPAASAAALEELTADGGTVIATCWPETLPPHRQSVVDALDAVSGTDGVPGCCVRERFAHTPEGLSELLLGDTGLVVTEATIVDWTWRTDRKNYLSSAAVWFDKAFARLDKDTRTSVREAVTDKVVRYRLGETQLYRFPCQAVVVVAHKS
ncbi:class I SAM-dependent methyltransferase [Corynebacterium mendelii]|uniref:Methyltransferase domain-containing protein n=1 Tax=Corynebacterium mendelii TaxID=2765362 RepID=A0A939E2M6_9CORY|nr:methyltransferase domain-containing protein [Corynebacterium mendelii]